MRATTASAVLVGLLCGPAGEAPSVHTLVQQDPWWSPLDSAPAAVSADGRYIAFTSYARLAPADTNRRRDIYVVDRLDGRLTLESVTDGGESSEFDSGPASLSGDGRFVVYETVIPTASGSLQVEILLRDRREGTVTLVSAPRSGERADGSSTTPKISRDSSVVVFSSVATNLVSDGDANGKQSDVYVYERTERTIRRLSVDSNGRQPATGSTLSPSVSADGRRVVFASAADLDETRPTSRAAPRAPPIFNIYLRDRDRQRTTRISVGSSGRPPDGSSWAPAISGNGRTVVFSSMATNLTAQDRNRSPDVFLADVETGSLEAISRRADRATANATSGSPVVSDDGRFVVFQSQASDLVCMRNCKGGAEDINLLWDVFLLDRESRVMTRVSGDAAGEWMAPSAGAAIDSAADVIVFSSRHPTEPSDLRNDFDLFIVARH
jgi:Tol biopolymer transport system component